MTASVPVLMYHAIAEDPAPATRRLSVAPDMFAAQLGLLRRLGCTTLTFGELASAVREGRSLPDRTVVLTFDDGYADFCTTALRLLTRYGCRATVFVTTGWIDDAGKHRAGTPLDRMMCWSQIDEVAAAGVEVGAHSHSHAELDQLPDVALGCELVTSRVLLADRLDRDIPSLAYPYGYSSPRVREAVCAAGYRNAAAVANVVLGSRHDTFALPRLTVSRSTDLDTFERLLLGRAITRTYLGDRTLTAGWSVVRQARYLRSTAGRR